MMFVFGDDFAFSNAFQNYEQIRNTVKNCNLMGKEFGITCVVSTPSEYVDSLKKENSSFPIKYDDFMNYYELENDHGSRTQYNFWSGFYSSRPGIKAHTKTGSA